MVDEGSTCDVLKGPLKRYLYMCAPLLAGRKLFCNCWRAEKGK